MLLGAAFLHPSFGFLAWVGFIPLLAALESRVAAGDRFRQLFGLGYAFGLVFYLIGTHWIALLSDVAMTVPWLKYPAWLLAGAYLALFAGLATALTGWLARRSQWPLAAVFPFVFLAVEELRASGEMGFPWFQPGYAQQAFVPVIQLASLGSVTLVTLWVFAVNALAWRAATGGSRLRAAFGAVLVFALPWLWGRRAIDAAPHGPGMPIALVQANIAGEIKWSGHHQREILATFLDMTEAAARDSARPRIAIWPETATGSYLLKQLDQRIAVTELVARTGVAVFSGFPDYSVQPGGVVRYVNGAGLIRPDGSTPEVYAKRHLVPFGERMPFQRLIPALGKLELGQAEWTAGDRIVLFPSDAGPFSCLVCFEAIFPDLTREDVRHGARWLVNVTNDEWFGNSAALDQHAAMAVFRAVENHVPLARCGNTGRTLIADANGRVLRRLPVFTPATLIAYLPPPGLETWFTRVGDWPGLVAAIVVAWLVASPWARALTPRSRAD